MTWVRVPYKDWPIEKKKEYRRRYRDKHLHNPQEIHRYNLTVRHGMSVETYNDLFEQQNGVCAICGQPETAKSTSKRGGIKRLGVDHNHATGGNRGLLCVKCNSGMGKLNDSISLLRAAIAYLEKH